MLFCGLTVYARAVRSDSKHGRRAFCYLRFLTINFGKIIDRLLTN